jgi:hypothetical protein
LQDGASAGTTKRAGEEWHMKSQLMLMGAASALLVSFACGCAAETGTDEGTSAEPKVGVADEKAGPADEKSGTTESPIIYGNPAGYNPPGYNPLAPGMNPPGYNPPGMGGVYGYPGGVGYGVGYPGYGVGLGYPGNINGGFNVPGPY